MDFFDFMANPMFAGRALVDAVNQKPNKYGRVRELGYFPQEGVATTYIEIYEVEGELVILPTGERGSSGQEKSFGKGKKRQVPIPHIPHIGYLKASALQNRMRFAQTIDQGLAIFAEELGKVIAEMSDNHYQTFEYHRVGGFKGEVLDADGSVIINLFDEYGIAQKVFDFDLGNDDANVPETCRNIVRHMEKNLRGEQMTGVRSLVSEEFWDAFIKHPSVKGPYEKYASEVEPVRNDVRKGFKFHGITFEEYSGSGSYKKPDGSYITRRFIESGDAHFMPEGLQKADRFYFAPPDNIDDINSAPTMDQPIHISLERMKHNKGIEIFTESNPLAFMKRPKLLVKGQA